LDQSSVEVDLQRRTVHVTLLQGIAADGVSRVGVVDGAGRLHATTVSRNLYLLADVPPGPDRAIEAFADTGMRVFEIPLSSI
jgi:hypothetical protein